MRKHKTFIKIFVYQLKLTVTCSPYGKTENFLSRSRYRYYLWKHLFLQYKHDQRMVLAFKTHCYRSESKITVNKHVVELIKKSDEQTVICSGKL